MYRSHPVPNDPMESIPDHRDPPRVRKSDLEALVSEREGGGTDPIEYFSDLCDPTPVTNSDLDASFSDPEGSIYQATSNIGMKSLSYEALLREPATMSGKEPALSFTEGHLVMHTVSNAAEQVASTIIDSDSSYIDHTLQLQRKFAFMPLSKSSTKIDHELSDVGFIANTGAAAIVETFLNKYIGTTETKIVNVI